MIPLIPDLLKLFGVIWGRMEKWEKIREKMSFCIVWLGREHKRDFGGPQSFSLRPTKNKSLQFGEKIEKQSV